MKRVSHKDVHLWEIAVNELEKIQTVRRKNINRVTAESFSGVRGRLADAVQMPRPNLYEMLAGKRFISEKTARRIEQLLGLNLGQLDKDQALDDSIEKDLIEAWSALKPDIRRLFITMIKAAAD